MRTLIPALVVGLALFAVPSSVAPGDWCFGWGQVIDVGGAAYVALDHHPIMTEEGYTLVWVYAEANGEPGLQRGGAALLGGSVDVCQESSRPDLGLAEIYT